MILKNKTYNITCVNSQEQSKRSIGRSVYCPVIALHLFGWHESIEKELKK